MSERLTFDDLVAWFHASGKRRTDFAIGLEWEKEIVRPDGTRLSYDGPDGIESLLHTVANRHGWTKQFEGDYLVGLERGGSTITLEPGGQVELSTPPHDSIFLLDEALRGHLAELQGAAPPECRILSTAYTPLQPVDDIHFLPKRRYDIMSSYLPQRGELSHGMMKGTTSVQATVDYADETDCANKVRLASAVSPLMLAITANSPLAGGHDTGLASYRAHCWMHTDNDRTGLLADLLDGGFSFEKYTRWLIDVPMMFAWRDGQQVSAEGRTFRSWMEDGWDGTWPDLDDFLAQVGSVFPEVRLKNFLELRAGDNGALPCVLAYAGLWKGLLSCEQGLCDGLTLVQEFPAAELPALMDLACREGLQGRWRGRSLAEWAGDIVTIASDGLDRTSRDGDRSDHRWLTPLRERIERGESPSQDVRRLFDRLGPGPEFLSALAYPPAATIPRPCC